MSLTYERFRKQAPVDVLIDFDEDYRRYSGGEVTDENHFYANCKYWEGKLEDPTTKVVREAMKIVSKDVRPPKAVRNSDLLERFKRDASMIVVPKDYYDQDSKDFERASLEDFIDDETLEEASLRCFEELRVLNPKGGIKEFIRLAVNFGANWQEKRKK